MFRKSKVERIIEKELSSDITIGNFAGEISRITKIPMSGDCSPPNENQDGSALMFYDLRSKGSIFVHAIIEHNPKGESAIGCSFVKKINVYISGKKIHHDPIKKALVDYLKNV